MKIKEEKEPDNFDEIKKGDVFKAWSIGNKDDEVSYFLICDPINSAFGNYYLVSLGCPAYWNTNFANIIVLNKKDYVADTIKELISKLKNEYNFVEKVDAELRIFQSKKANKDGKSN